MRDSLQRSGEPALLQRLAALSDPSQLRVDFAVSAWADCRQSECGRDDGVQVRLLKCQLHVGHASASVEEGVCDAFGVSRPASTRVCTDTRCPRWLSGAWSDCAASRCVRHGTALQRREVRCEFANGTLATSGGGGAGEPLQCDRRARPKLKRECENGTQNTKTKCQIWCEF